MNNFSNPVGINAYDNGTNNMWDNGEKGNSWHDYEGCDSNNDGIGEKSYDIPGIALAQDRYPLTTKSCGTIRTLGSLDIDEVDKSNEYLQFILENQQAILYWIIVIEVVAVIGVIGNKIRKTYFTKKTSDRW